MGDHVLGSSSVFPSENSKQVPISDLLCVCISLSGNQELWSLPFLGEKMRFRGSVLSPREEELELTLKGPNSTRFYSIIVFISIPEK